MNTGELFRKLRVLRERPSRIADYLREPRNIVVGGALANRLGLQLARIVKDTALWQLRRERVDASVREAYETIERDGIVVIHDFLPPEAFAEVQAEVRRAEVEDTDKWRRTRFGENFECHGFCPTDYPDRYPAFRRHLRDNEFLMAVACAVSRRRKTFPPHIEFQKTFKPDWSRPHQDLDYNQYAHTDRHYPFVKAFLYLTDVDASTAPYCYAPGTHRMWTRSRLRYEYAYSNRYVTARRGRYERTSSQLEADQELRALTTRLLSDLGMKEQPVLGSANTLIISNNQGIHKRGDMTGNRARVMATIDFKYLESAAQWMHPVLKHLYR